MIEKTKSSVAQLSVSQSQEKPRPAVPDATNARNPFLDLDRKWRAFSAHIQGPSAYSLVAAWGDWAWHFGQSPGRAMELVQEGLHAAGAFGHSLQATLPGQTGDGPVFDDDQHRFDQPQWRAWPYCLWRDAFLATERLAKCATAPIPGMAPARARRVAFATQQLLEAYSPANYPLLNPVVVGRTIEESGHNLLRGWQQLITDTTEAAGQKVAGSEAFTPGVDVAATPGSVIFKNELIELIQYAPTTDAVLREPILIVPAWIMKYYVLDLAQRHSLIRFLVDQGHTVFVISWKNPTAADRDLALDSYRRLGILAALDVIAKVLPNVPVHACGYCLGGTLLAIAAGVLARESDDRLASITLLAAQTDFSEAGELMLFVDESQVSSLEALMWQKGFLGADQMAGAFRSLRSKDLIWSQAVRKYWLGEADQETDLGAWNADQTRMPYRMHSEYLRGLFLENRLTAGRFAVDGEVVALKDITAPMFVIGTETDHIAPWRSVYKISLFTNNELTFALTNGGHNAGIVSEPGHPRRHFMMGTRHPGDRYVAPDAWLANARLEPGSWWPAWSSWLAARSSAERVSPPAMGAPADGLPPIMPAPGLYIHDH
jgi:polyhydroxyalkanoate synthase